MTVETVSFDEFTDESDQPVAEPPDACVNFEECGNRIPTAESMCADCLDKARHNDSTTA